MLTHEDKNKDEEILKNFVLPLYNLNMEILKEGYMNAYLKKDGSFLFIELSTPIDFSNNQLSQGEFKLEERVFYLFQTNVVHLQNIKYLIDGKYSQMDERAKNDIITLSGMVYRKTHSGTMMSRPLMALLKVPQYKKSLESKFGITLKEEDELIDKLSSNAFIESII